MEYLLSAKFLKVVLAAAVIFILLDMLWIGILASKFYTNHLGYLAELNNGKITFKLPVGILVQFIISLGLSAVIIMALQLDNRMLVAMLVGACAGFVIYFTYDFTNYSFVKNWSLFVSVIDVLWGTAQGLMAGLYTYWFWNKVM